MTLFDIVLAIIAWFVGKFIACGIYDFGGHI